MNGINFSFSIYQEEFSSNPKIKDQGIDTIITKSLPTGLDYFHSGILMLQFKASESSFNV